MLKHFKSLQSIVLKSTGGNQKAVVSNAWTNKEGRIKNYLSYGCEINAMSVGMLAKRVILKKTFFAKFVSDRVYSLTIDDSQPYGAIV